MKPSTSLRTITLTLCLLLGTTGVVWAQASDRVAETFGISNEMSVILVTAIAAPTLGTLLKYWIDSRTKSYTDQWTVVAESKNQILADRDRIFQELREKEKEINELEKERRESDRAIAQIESKLALYKYRLSMYEPVTGQAPRERPQEKPQ